jgi:hypothetical protein
MQTAEANQQLGLIGFDEAIQRVFAGKEVKNGKGVNVGTVFSPKSRKDIAEALDLKGKENRDALDAAILKQSDEAFRVVKGQIAQLGGDWTLGKISTRTLSNGVRQIAVTVKEIKRQVGPKDEEIAKALGWSVEQVREARARQEEAMKPVELAKE